MNKTKNIAVLKQFSILTIGILLNAIAILFFFNPNNLAAGGVQGIALFLNKMFNLNISYTMFFFSAVIFVCAFLIVGKEYGIKTLYSTLGISISMMIIEKLVDVKPLTTNPLLAAVFGSTLIGIGLAIIFNENASVGGTSTIAKILNKLFHVDQVKTMILLDLLITLLSIWVFGIEIGLYDLVAVFIMSEALNRAVLGIDSRKQIMIMTDKYELIGDYIINQFKNSCTYFYGEGAYKKTKQKIVYTVLSNRELIKLKLFIKENAPNSFITISESHEVIGKGFKNM